MKKFLAILLLVLSPFAAQAQLKACTTTVSAPGSNVRSAVSNASPGDVICLNNGTYDIVDLSDIQKSNYVTIRSFSGVGAKGYWRFYNTRFIRLENVTGGVYSAQGWEGVGINGCSQNIQIVGYVGTPNSGEGINIDQSDTVGCNTTPQNILIDGAVLDRIGQVGGEGRLSLRHANTVTIRNSQFLGIWQASGTAVSDGIQMWDEDRNIVIGPGNIFKDITTINGFCTPEGVHCDGIQTFAGNGCVNISIDGNYFENVNTFILNESLCTGTNTFRNNVLNVVNSGQWHEWQNLDWSHNTVYNSAITINSVTSFTTSATFNNNIFHNSTWVTYDYDGGGPGAACQSCTLDSNIFTLGCSGMGTNCTTTAPTYSGTGSSTPPSTWQGWKLQAGSAGEGSGSDGKNRGTLHYHLSAPSNLQYNP